MKNPKLSIILPVYNVEQYLDKCLTNILESTFKDFELIILNDGTKDNSEDIINKYIEKYKEKIIYIKKENTGLSDTRNVGLTHAKGEYITFVDSDDYIEKNMYEEMFKKIETFPYDIVACDVKLVYEDSNVEQIVSSGYNNDMQDKEEIKRTMTVQYPTVWNKIYKSSLINDIRFSKGVWYEDVEFMLKIYPRVSSIGVVKKPLYNYLQRKNSITYTYNEQLYDIIDNMTNVIEYYKQNEYYDTYYNELEYLYARYAFATFPKRLAKCGNKEKYFEGIEYAKEKVLSNFKNYKKNKYLSKMGFKGFYIKHFNKLLADINYMIQNKKEYN